MLKDIDSKEIFKFQMNTPLSKNTVDTKNQEIILMDDTENNKIKKLEQKINKLENDVIIIKQILFNEKQNKNECTIQ